MIEIRGDKKVLITPISEEDLADIKIGDIVWLDGDLMTCRDVAHRRLVEYGRELPYDIKDKAIFHAGPIVRKIEESRSSEKMRFWSFKKKRYPLFVFLSSLFLIVFGLCMARSVKCSFFLAGCFVWLMLFGCRRRCLRMLPVLIFVGGSFATLAYFAYGKDGNAAMAMANRFASVFLAAALGMSVEPADMTRNLATLKMPRGVTLGMLIATSFPPVLGAEIKRVREAMKTRGAGSVFNPKIFYRAFLVPFVMRLVNISDTLSLSVETRGFSLEKVPYTVYKKEIVCMSDVLFISGLVAGAVCTVVI